MCEKCTTIIPPKKILSTGPQNPKYIKIRCTDKEHLEKFRTLICSSELSNTDDDDDYDDDDDDDNNNNNNNLFNTGKK